MSYQTRGLTRRNEHPQPISQDPVSYTGGLYATGRAHVHLNRSEMQVGGFLIGQTCGRRVCDNRQHGSGRYTSRSPDDCATL